MKSLLILTLVGFLATQASATPTKRKPQLPKANLEQQLAKYISYPDVLRQTRQPGVVVIQFKINADDKLAQLEVFSQNEQLNDSLIRQLTGKKMARSANNSDAVYTVRLRFQP